MCFLIVGLLLTLTALSYLLGTALQMICNDTSPPDYVVFREVTDEPSLWGGRTLVGAITESTTGLSINVSLAGFLRYDGEDKDSPLCLIHIYNFLMVVFSRLFLSHNKQSLRVS